MHMTAAKQEPRAPQTDERDPNASGAFALKYDNFLLEVADVVNTTLDLDTLMIKVAESIKSVINYEIFAIMLLNERTQELRVRFQIGHPPELAERLRLKVGEGITGQAVAKREAVLINDITKDSGFISTGTEVRSELAVPLIVKNRVIGVIDIEAAQPGAFTEEHKRILTLVASRVAAGIENARLYTRVAKQAQQLTVLNEVSRELTSILNLDQLLKRIGDLLSRLIDYQMFSILLLDPSGTKLEHRFSLRFKENIYLKHDIPLGRGLVGKAAETGEPVLVPDVSKDERYIPINEETRSELCVPLIYKDKVIGVLDLEHTRRGYFTEDHVRTLTTLAAQVAIAIENARLYERLAQEEERLERDLAMARELQFRLLPHCCPTLKSAELAAKYVPAHAIGGDLYDFLEYSLDRTGIAVGDVSGKGAPAALYAALVGGILRSIAATEPGAADMLAGINMALHERQIEGQFVSVAYAVWDDEHRLMQIASSGLPRPIHCRKGKTSIIQATGIPLGLFPDTEYDEFNIQAKPGDVFVLFSDGIVDARRQDGEGYGRKRVEDVVRANCEKSADDIVTAIFKSVAEFSIGTPAFDDQTVVVIKVK